MLECRCFRRICKRFKLLMLFSTALDALTTVSCGSVISCTVRSSCVERCMNQCMMGVHTCGNLDGVLSRKSSICWLMKPLVTALDKELILSCGMDNVT